jgi:hypothetical protein
VDSLIERGEPAEGVCSLAWPLHNRHVAVRGRVNVAIRDLTHCLVDPAHMVALAKALATNLLR